MKFFYVTIFIICFFYSANSQDLKFNELMNIIHSDVGGVNSILSVHGWKYHHKTKADSLGMYNVTWGYNAFEDDTVGKAIAWVDLKIWFAKSIGVLYQFHSLKTYQNILNGIIKMKAIKQSSNVNEEDDSIDTIYYGKTYVYILKSNSSKTTYSPYSIIIQTKQSYLWH